MFLGPLLAVAATAQGRAPAPAPAATERVVPATPEIAWQLDKPNFYHRVPARGGTVWLGGKHLTAHRITTGEELYRAKRAGPWRHPTDGGGGLVFARHQDGTLHAFVPDLSRELWQAHLRFSHWAGIAHGDIYFVTSGNDVVAITGGKEHWRVDLGAHVNMRPATDGTRIYAATQSGKVVAIGLHHGNIVWQYESDAIFGSTSPTVGEGVVILADRGIKGDRKAACNAFDAETGELLWSSQFGSTGFSRPSIEGDRVWAGFGIRVAPFDLKTGAIDWDRSIKTGRNPFGLPGAAGDAIVFGNLDGNLYVHDRKTHALRWRLQVGTDDRSQVGGWQVHDSMLIVGSTRGVFAIKNATGKPAVELGYVLQPPSK